jgi:bromodomain adjacent to zinc finger domain protein 1A
MSQTRFRDLIEDNFQKLSSLRGQLRDLQTEENKRLNNERSERWRKKMEKAKEKSATTTASLNNPNNNKDNSNKSLQNTSNTFKEELEEEEKATHESNKKREEFLKKEKSLLEEIYECQLKCSMSSLGKDRHYKRYWVFKSVPGVFVENDESVFTQFHNNLDSESSSSVKIEDPSSSKENEPKVESDIQKYTAYRLPSTNNNHNKLIWSFYFTPESIDQLVSSLNQRGIRESELRQNLEDLKDKIVQQLTQTNKNSSSSQQIIKNLTMSPEDIESSLKNCLKENVYNVMIQNSNTNLNKKIKTKQQQQNLQSSSSSTILNPITAQECMELDLRDQLIELQEQIYVGALGSLKVNDRTKWKEALQRGVYDPQCSNLIWGDTGARPALEITNCDALKNNRFNHVISTSMHEVEDHLKENFHVGVVNNLAKVLLQIEQSVEKKFLRQPLGDSLKTPERKKSSKSSSNFDGNQQHTSDQNQNSTVLNNWEKTLMNCTTISQLFVHLQTFDESIAWSKSVLNTKCKLCNRKGDAEKMLLCDKCDRGHHIYCLRPPLSAIPQGEWFCPKCKPKTVEKTPRKIRKSFAANQDDMYSADEEEAPPKKNQRTSKNQKYESTDENDEIEEEEQESKNNHKRGGASSRSNTKNQKTTNGHVSENDDDDLNTRGRKKKPTTTVLEEKPTARLNGRQSKISSASLTSMISNAASVDSTTSNLKRSRRGTGKSVNLDYNESATNSGNNSDEEEELHAGKKTKRTKSQNNNNNTSTNGSFTNDTSSRNSELTQRMKEIESILNELMKHEDSWPFLKPVPKREAHYYEVIAKPMDFSKIKNNINNFKYNDYTQIVEDIRLVFQNCKSYNEPGSDIYKTAQRMANLFENKAKKAGLLDAKLLTSPRA